MASHDFEKLITKTRPHILEIICLSLDYKTFKNALEVNKAWRGILTTKIFMEKAKAVFEEGILEDENRLFDVIIKSRIQDMRKILSTGMVNVDCVEQKSGRTPLALKINLLPKNKRAGKRFKDVVQLLLDAGADPRKADKDGDTPLIIASLCKYDQREVVQLLLHRGADPNKGGKYGNTPLHILHTMATKMWPNYCLTVVQILIRQMMMDGVHFIGQLGMAEKMWSNSS